MPDRNLWENPNGPGVPDLSRKIGKAVAQFWATRKKQGRRQGSGRGRDRGLRSEVTGGKQMDGFVRLITELMMIAGLERKFIFHRKKLELPGYFRAEKQWDILAVKNGQLLVAIEAKSQTGPSFGNNFNNRTEEAIGSAVDLWTAYREGALNKDIKPWLGYLFLLEDAPRSRKPVSVREPHFPILPEFREASYADRYEILCRKLARERHYNMTSLVLSNRDEGPKGKYTEPNDLRLETFARSLMGHVSAFA